MWYALCILLGAVVVATVGSGVFLELRKELVAGNAPLARRIATWVLGCNVSAMGLAFLGGLAWALTGVADVASAAEGAEVAAAAGPENLGACIKAGLGFLGMGVSTGIAAAGAGIGAGIAGAAGIGAISEKPDMLGKSLIYIGLAEGVAIYGLLISFIIMSKIG